MTTPIFDARLYDIERRVLAQEARISKIYSDLKSGKISQMDAENALFIEHIKGPNDQELLDLHFAKERAESRRLDILRSNTYTIANIKNDSDRGVYLRGWAHQLGAAALYAKEKLNLRYKSGIDWIGHWSSRRYDIGRLTAPLRAAVNAMSVSEAVDFVSSDRTKDALGERAKRIVTDMTATGKLLLEENPQLKDALIDLNTAAPFLNLRPIGQIRPGVTPKTLVRRYLDGKKDIDFKVLDVRGVEIALAELRDQARALQLDIRGDTSRMDDGMDLESIISEISISEIGKSVEFQALVVLMAGCLHALNAALDAHTVPSIPIAPYNGDSGPTLRLTPPPNSNNENINISNNENVNNEKPDFFDLRGL